MHGIDGMDEISISGKSLVWEVSEQKVSPPYEVSPQYFGFKSTSLAEIKGGTPEENASILRRVLNGERGSWREVVVMNAAAALLAGNRVSDLKNGARLAEEVIDSGQAQEKLEALIRVSQSLG